VGVGLWYPVMVVYIERGPVEHRKLRTPGVTESLMHDECVLSHLIQESNNVWVWFVCPEKFFVVFFCLFF